MPNASRSQNDQVLDYSSAVAQNGIRNEGTAVNAKIVVQCNCYKIQMRRERCRSARHALVLPQMRTVPSSPALANMSAITGFQATALTLPDV